MKTCAALQIALKFNGCVETFSRFLTGGDNLKNRSECNIFPIITSAFLHLLVTLFLLWCGTSGYEGIADAKHRMFYVICGGYIFVIMVVAIELAIVNGEVRLDLIEILRKASWTQRFVVIYILVTWGSAICSEFFPDTIWGTSRYEGALTITIYGMCFLLVSTYGKVSKSLLFSFGIAVSVFSLLCLAQLTGSNIFFLYPEGYNYFGAYEKYAGSFLGTIGNVDLVAAFLSIAIPIMWIGLLRIKGKEKLWLSVPLIVSFIVLLKMNVLAGIVGVFVGSIIATPVVLRISRKKKLLIIAAIGICAILGVFLLYTKDIKSGFFYEMHQILHGNWDDSFGSGRIHIWKHVLKEIPANFLLGSGPDTMLYAEIDAFVRYDEILGTIIVSQIDVAHNEYLNVLYHQGVLGLISYMSILISLTNLWLKESPNNTVVAILGGAALCYCVQAFFGFSMYITAPFIWIILALLEKYSKKE